MGRTADFTGVTDYEPVIAGQYTATPESYEWKDVLDPTGKTINPATGKPYQYANYKWVIRDEVDAEGNPVEGKVFYNTYSENPKSLFAMKRDAVALGEDPELFDDNVDLDVVLGNMKGREGLVTLSVDEYKKPDGTVRRSNKVQKVEAVSNVPASVSARR